MFSVFISSQFHYCIKMLRFYMINTFKTNKINKYLFKTVIVRLVNRFVLFLNVRQDICPWKPAAAFPAYEARSWESLCLCVLIVYCNSHAAVIMQVHFYVWRRNDSNVNFSGTSLQPQRLIWHVCTTGMSRNDRLLSPLHQKLKLNFDWIKL